MVFRNDHIKMEGKLQKLKCNTSYITEKIG